VPTLTVHCGSCNLDAAFIYVNDERPNKTEEDPVVMLGICAKCAGELDAALEAVEAAVVDPPAKPA